MENNRYIAIMAGGSGTRLWPLSRNSFSKQFLSLNGGRSFIQMTYDRIKDIVPNERIFIATNKRFESIVKEQLPEILPQNIILEPAIRDSAPAIGLITSIIHKMDPTGVLATIGADHYVKDVEGFKESFETAFSFVDKYPEGILTMGINPTSPETGYGYIEMGEPKDKIGKSIIFSIGSFKEKPDANTAAKFLKSWKYLWNANYFIFQTGFMVNEYKKFLPETAAVIESITNSYGTDKFGEVLEQRFPECEKIAIDYAIMEKTTNSYVLPATFEDWVDIGNWKTFKEVLVKEEKENYSNTTNHYDLDSEDILVHVDDQKLVVATLGLKDVAIVSTKDAIFISKKSRSHELKKLLEKIPEEYK